MRSGILADMLKHLPKAYHAAKGWSKCRDCSANGDGRRPDLRPVSVASSRYLTATVHVVNSNDLDRSKQDAMPPRKLTLGQQLRGYPIYSPTWTQRGFASESGPNPSAPSSSSSQPTSSASNISIYTQKGKKATHRRDSTSSAPSCTLPAGRIQGPP